MLKFSVRTSVGLLVSAFIFATAFAQSNEYPRAEERAKLLNVLQGVMNGRPRLEISDINLRPASEQKFLLQFKNEIFPRLFEARRLNSISGILNVALDRALYDNDEEKTAWTEQMEKTQNELSKIATAPEFKLAIAKWSTLSTGLTGELPELARESYEVDQLTGFTTEQLPLVERSTALSNQISTKANESKVTGHDLSVFQKQMEEIEKQFRSGTISFPQATEKLDNIWAKSFHAKGNDVAQSAKSELNELAIIRTQLAKAKGFATWTDYRLSTAKYTYAEGFQTADDHINFLTSVLEKTLPAHLAYQDWIKKQNPQIADQIDNRNSFLLAPETDTLISEYFPVESVNDFWRKTMIQSGFDPKVFDWINLDSFPRENKQTHAYMSPTVMPQPRVVRVREGTLSLEVPTPGQARWLDPQIYIVQNARKDGMDAYSTVFHEGGHALDFSQRQTVLESDEAYAYSETASMTMERFFSDREFLLATGKARDGRSVSPAIVDQYLKNTKMLEALGNRGQVLNALFDFLLWREAYTNDGPSFVDRAIAIYEDLQNKYFPGKKVYPEGVQAGSRMFSTSHFYSGEVRYFGYIYADMVSEMTAQFLWDTFEAKTGRRSFYRQPEMAKILLDGQYRKGFSKPFPKATTDLVGKPFDPNVIVDVINKQVLDGTGDQGPSSCEGLLAKK